MNILWLTHYLPVQTFKIGCGVLLGLLAMQAVAKPALATAGDKSILLMPSANPYALTAYSGIATVRFSVQVAGKNKLPATVYLRRLGDKENIAMNDFGKDGDLVARDGIYGVNVQIDTAKIKADSCLVYEALTQQERDNLKSPPLKLCVSSFPIGIAPVNITNPARWGDDTRAAADEVLITVAPEINASTIRKLARSISARVAGSILPLNFYQLKLPAPASPDQLLAHVLKLRKSPGVTSASVNLLGQGALNVNDAAFDLAPSDVNSQHGLKLVLGHTPPADANAANAWDGNNRGAGKKVVVMDTGLDLTNPDLPDTWTCQLIPAPPAPLMNPTVETPCTASIVGTTPARHGTLVAGVIAASATIGGAEGSGEGIAGGAFNSTIHSMKMTGFDLANQTQAFNQAVVYRGEHADALVYNASFNVLNAFAPVADVTALCGAINSLVLSGATARAIVVNSAGNNNSNGLSYPGRCNDPHTGGATGTDALSALGKPLLITVANSVSFLTNDCGNGVGPLPNNCGTGVVGAQACIDQLCRANIAGGTPHLGSNYGAWVDIAAPGSKIRSTTIVGTGDGGGNYVSETGTTMAAPFVSGAAAILLSCGVPIGGVENVLKTSATVTVPFPDGTSAKRLDIKLATASCNQPPETNAGSGSGLEDATAIAVTLSGSDVGGSVASFQITSLPDNGVLFSDAGLTTAISVSGTVSASANTATVYFVPAHNFNGSTSFNYASIDNLGMTDPTPAIATITVTAVNDPPSFVKGADQTVLEDAGAQAVSGWATSLSKGPADEAGQVLSFIITGNTNPALFSAPPAVSSVGTLTYTPATDANGSATITVAVMDNGTTANGGVDTSASQTFMINVTPVNDAPSGVVGIDGIRKYTTPVPSFLHAVTSGVNNPDGWSIDHYQWRESIAPPPGDTPVNITIATNPTATSLDYQLQVTDVEKYMSVCAIYSDPSSTQLCSGTDTAAVGDPHITTVDGLHYDFQSAGEFVALRNSSGLELQVRQSPVSTAMPLTDAYSGLTNGVSVNSAIAARVGKHRVTYQADANNNTASGAPVLRVDGVVTSVQAGDVDLGDGGRVTSQGNGIQIDFPDQTTLIVSTGQWVNNVWWMHLSVYHTSAYEGIMGARLNGSWLPRLSDGSALGVMPASLHDRYVQLYEKFADSWRVTNETSLFDYAKGTSTATFTNKAWPTENGPYVTGSGPVAQPLAKEAAVLACGGVMGKNEKADCVFDVRVMGHKDIAKGHLLNQKIRLGATNVIVRGPVKLNERGDLAITATVARHAMVVPQVKGLRNVPAGTVQFMLGGKLLGKPVKLDEKGLAKLVVKSQILERFNVGKQAITARYLPTRDRGNVFLPSVSRQLTREVVKLSPVVRDIR